MARLFLSRLRSTEKNKSEKYRLAFLDELVESITAPIINFVLYSNETDANNKFNLAVQAYKKICALILNVLKNAKPDAYLVSKESMFGIFNNPEFRKKFKKELLKQIENYDQISKPSPISETEPNQRTLFEQTQDLISNISMDDIKRIRNEQSIKRKQTKQPKTTTPTSAAPIVSAPVEELKEKSKRSTPRAAVV